MFFKPHRYLLKRGIFIMEDLNKIIYNLLRKHKYLQRYKDTKT